MPSRTEFATAVDEIPCDIGRSKKLGPCMVNAERTSELPLEPQAVDVNLECTLDPVWIEPSNGSSCATIGPCRRRWPIRPPLNDETLYCTAELRWSR